MSPFSDLIEIAANTRSQYRQASDSNDGDHGSVILPDDNNEILKGIDMIKFKQMQEADGSLQTLRLKARQNYSRC